MQHIVIINQKGGVGKTTTAVNLAAVFAAVGKRVLLLDIDPQSNATCSFKLSGFNGHLSSYEMLMGNQSIKSCIHKTQVTGLDIIPATGDLVAAELELVNQDNREQWLKRRLTNVENDYDIVVSDCPPANGLISLNALVAADLVILPIQCEYLALDGLAKMLKTVSRIKKTLNRKVKVAGILLTMYDKRSALSRKVVKEVQEFFGDYVFESIIPRNVRLSEAPSFNLPGVLYDHLCSGSQAYMNLCKELLEKYCEKVVR